MEKRTYNRVPADLKVQFCSCETIYAGTIKNISERGVLIITSEISFPFDLEFELAIQWKGSVIHVPVCLRRLVTLSRSVVGIAGVLLKPTSEYLDMVSNLNLEYNKGANV